MTVCFNIAFGHIGGLSLELLPRYIARPAGTPIRFTCRYRSDRQHRIEFSDPQPESRRWSADNIQHFNPSPNEGWTHGAYKDYSTVVTFQPRIVTCIVINDEDDVILGTLSSRVVPFGGHGSWWTRNRPSATNVHPTWTRYPFNMNNTNIRYDWIKRPVMQGYTMRHSYPGWIENQDGSWRRIGWQKYD